MGDKTRNYSSRISFSYLDALNSNTRQRLLRRPRISGGLVLSIPVMPSAWVRTISSMISKTWTEPHLQPLMEMIMWCSGYLEIIV